jgi:hypothetical protein
MISQKTRSSLTVFIGSILVTIGTIILVAMASGYNINLFNWEISSFGLLKLNTNPGGATIKINSKVIKQKTPYQTESIKTGNVKVEYSKDGYHDWLANFTVEAGLVTFADYALLIPKDFDIKKIESETKASSLVTSADNDKVFMLAESPGAVFEIQKNNTYRRIGELPINAALRPPSKLTDTLISQDGSALITKLNYPDSRPVYFWLSTNTGSYVNLEDLLGQGFSQPYINPKNSREVFALSAGQLERTNVDSRISLKLPPTNIATLYVDSDYVYTVENNPSPTVGQALYRYDHNGNNKLLINKFDSAATSSLWGLRSSKLGSLTYLSAINSSDGSLSLVKIDGDKITSSLVGVGCSLPSFSENGRFLSYYQNNVLKTIDLEYVERYGLDYPGITSIRWFTNYQMLFEKADGLFIVDFNGYNVIQLPPLSGSITKAQPVFINTNKTIYYINAQKVDYYPLQSRSQLINF